MAKRWQRVLAGDVGGTKTWLALYENDEDGPRCVAEAKLPSADHDSLEAAIRTFLGGRGETSIDAAGFGIAGPVRGRRVETTNLPWTIDADALGESLHFGAVALVNDFHAVALGIDALPASSLATLHEGEITEGGPRVIVGAGTGLGVAVVAGERVLGSEGGHLAFAPRDAFERDLLDHLRQTHERVSVERVVSGPGLEAIYEFVVATERAPTHASPNDGAAIAEAAARGDAAASLALERFVSAYGAAAGELALAVLATGGLYVAGGIAPKLHASMEAPTFAETFVAGMLPKGRMRALMEATRVVLVKDPKVGLLGARAAAIAAARR